MVTKADLCTLAERVEAGEGEEVWHDILLAITNGKIPAYKVPAALAGGLDAAKYLHDAALPGWEWKLYGDGRAYVSAGGDWTGLAKASNPAVAWVAAILRAKAQGLAT